jgi:hypothetical protein
VVAEVPRYLSFLIESNCHKLYKIRNSTQHQYITNLNCQSKNLPYRRQRFQLWKENYLPIVAGSNRQWTTIFWLYLFSATKLGFVSGTKYATVECRKSSFLRISPQKIGVEVAQLFNWVRFLWIVCHSCAVSEHFEVINQLHLDELHGYFQQGICWQSFDSLSHKPHQSTSITWFGDYFLFLTFKNTRKSYQNLRRCERRVNLCINVEGQRFQRSL